MAINIYSPVVVVAEQAAAAAGSSAAGHGDTDVAAAADALALSGAPADQPPAQHSLHSNSPHASA